ncbi:OprD family porin [Stutzerimonas tarimensis]|uniref:OprD family porin n=1 Tax=Stutzerimonas tarimensis TaxID=1507735 RepID=A0ABV7T7P8_9GAMM
MYKRSIVSAMAVAVLAQWPATSAQAAFVEDSKATLGLRNFYINADPREGVANRQEEWGQGLILNFASGYTHDGQGIGIDALGLLGVRLDSGKGRHGNPTSNAYGGVVFPTDGDGRAASEFSSLGLTGKLKLSSTELKVGTLQPRLPVVTFNDGRLLPQTFLGAQITSTELAGLTLIAGQLERAKGRNSSDSRGLSIAGANNARSGRFSNEFRYAGLDYRFTERLLGQYYYGRLDEFYAQHFVGLVHQQPLPTGSLKTDLRYFDSRAVGANASAEGRSSGYRSAGYWRAGDPEQGKVDNRTWSALFTYSLQGHAISLGHQRVEGPSAFPFLNQGDGATAALITDRQLGKFLNAGQRTWLAEYGYDFGRIGVPGLKAVVTYLNGTGIDTSQGSRQEWERDIRVDYQWQDGPLKGLGLSWRNASLRSDVATDLDENRLILSYSLPLL